MCDDGTQLPLTGSAPVLCDLGSDCADCGAPWAGVAHTPTWREGVGPIEFLRKRKIEVNLGVRAFFWVVMMMTTSSRPHHHPPSPPPPP